MNRNKKIVYSALFLAIGIVLPFLTAQVKEIGDTLLPMHFPVMLCGFLCGPWYGLAVGFLLPFSRSVLFGMPPIFPNACWMALELATYGFVTGWLYQKANKKTIGWTYVSLIVAMLLGRVVWGLAKTVLLGFGDNPFTFSAFFVGGFLDAIPGIVLQLLIIPLIITLIEKNKK